MTDINKLPLKKQIELAKNHNTTSEVLQQLDLGKPNIQQLLASNPNTPIAILEKVSGSYYEEVVDNPVFELLLLENSDRQFIKLCLAKSTKTSAATLEKLSCDRDSKIQQAVVRNPNISAKIIDKFAKSRFMCMLHLNDLIKHVDKISTATWSVLANYQDLNIRGHFVSSAQAPIEIMMALSNDTNIQVRSGLVENRHLPLKILTKLAEDIEVDVRRTVAKNTRTPEEILIKLAQDSEHVVRRRIAHNSSTSTILLAKLAQDTSHHVRYEVARNPHTSVDILIKLAQDSNYQVRYALTKNPNTPVQILRKLQEDGDRS